MASSNVSQFLQTIGQGVKPNMFLIDIQFPASIALQTEDQNLTNILCKSAALPGSNLGVIEVPFRGRTVKIAGDRTFDTWTTTFFNDKDFKLRAFFEQWANSINTHEGNTAPLFTPNNSDGYMADLGVKQLEKDASEEGAILREYTLKYCFPTNVSSIDLAYDSNDQIEEFTVEWQYSYFTAEGGSRAGVSTIGVV
ncbi:tail tube [Synechococcus phage S-WAM2]|jgi:hypothetical protein|uniref:Tail tube protein n=1 Tax=Synechococcus phage S-WAM2 TaxID=1815522 RepID=A0A1D8KTD6_9CAUD|nr:tail tube [Synechococcus phage S-WAM2]AOV61814.1 tail tube protein [Synechococcus phage S-WAM2]